MIILYILIIGLALYLQYYVAKQFEAAAAAKGYVDSKYFHLSFWLGLPGWLLVIALPVRSESSTTATAATQQNTVTITEGAGTPKNGKCEVCGAESAELNYCEIKDQLGTRYRNLCPECIAQHNVTKKM